MLNHRVPPAYRILLLFLLFVFSTGVLSAQDRGWPRQQTLQGAKLVYYPPQVDDWKEFKTLDARLAIELTPAGGKTYPGVATVQLQTAVDIDSHTVLLTNPHVTGTYFPSVDRPTAQKLGQQVRTFLPSTATLTISLDRLVASVQKSKTPPAAPVKNDPPTIFVSLKPAILLMVEGTPVLAPIPGSNLQFVANSNWPLFQAKSGPPYFLFDGKGWLTATTLQGNWTPTTILPKEMSKVPQDKTWADLKPYIPPPPASAATYPAVYYSSVPAEIVVFSGLPNWTPIPGTQLVYAANTASTVFKDNSSSTIYYLTSGRWFSAQRPLGPWTFATYDLPADFKKIPPNSPQGRVLAAVPGTPEAEDAVLLAQIPTTAVVNPSAASQVNVSYAGGQPQFQPIEGTTLSYASNTPNRVILVGTQYYLCQNGVWFVSNTAMGPWQLAPTVPEVIYTIPPSCPVYNVTYVTQQTLPSGSVQSSYTAGYMGMFIAGAAVGAIVASGTGYYYPPYVYGGFYYPYAATYGYHSYYNPYIGAYGAGGSAYGPYGSAHWGASYNPTTGTYARGATASDAYGSRSVAQAYNPYTGNYGATRQGSNAYGSWGQSYVSNGSQSAYTQHASNAYGSVGTVQGSQGGKGAATSTAYGNTAAGKTSSGDMYAAHDGNVYKNTGSGWQTYNNGSWNNVQKPNPTSNPNYSADQQKAQSYQQQHPNDTQNLSQSRTTGSQSLGQSNPGGSGGYHPSGGSSSWGDLNQEAQNRQRGEQQSQRFSQYQHSGGWGDRSGGGDRWGGGGGWGGDRGRR